MRIHDRAFRVLSLAALFMVAGCATGSSTTSHGDGGKAIGSDDANEGSDDAAVDAPSGNDAGSSDATAPDSGANDASRPVDASEKDSSESDSSEPTDAGNDVGTGDSGEVDSSVDSSETDAGVDSGLHDADSDTGSHDAETDAFDAGADTNETDAGSDGSVVTIDSGVDSDVVDGGIDANGTIHDAAVDAWDGSTCVVVTTPDDDAGAVPDANACSFGGATCTPQITSFTPLGWVPPTSASACSAAEIQTFYTGCLEGSTFTTCQKYLSGGTYATCGACLFTSRSASAYGPIIYQTVSLGGSSTEYFFSPNYAGCVSLYESCNSGCAETLQELDDCEAQACNDTSCANDTNSADYTTCFSDSDNCACYGYSQASNACWNEFNASSHPAAACQNIETSEADFTTIAEKFCWNGT